MIGTQIDRLIVGTLLGLAPVATVSLVNVQHAAQARRPTHGGEIPGLTIAPAPGTGAPHLLVTSVQSRSRAEAAGVAAGDELVSIDRRPVGSLQQAREAVMMSSADTVSVGVRRHGRISAVRLPRGSRPDHGS